MELKEIRKKERRTENERRKEQMIDVAFICFSEKGMEATSISDIAKEAAFGEATVYRYFSNKETLVLECGKKFLPPTMGKISDIKNFRYVHVFEHSGCYNADTDEKQE